MKQGIRIDVSETEPEICRAIASDPNFTSAEIYKAEANGHKFKPGDICILTGLESYPEHNGEQVKITAYRQDGPWGKAYYVEGEINEACNWVYEYRLKLFTPEHN